LTFVLLVGDGPQIPPYPSPYGDSDPSYGYILGGDSYAEVFVGRFSADNLDDLNTQVQRTLFYEMTPDVNGDWYRKAVCIASDQGPGDDNELDYEHERNIRSKYLAYTYLEADELYDGSQGLMDASGDPSATDLNNSINAGRGVITYTGHGSTSSLGTTGYSISDVSGLTNINQLPFFWSVACVNGDFNNSTCLAEALLRAKTGTGKPTGAIATFMSTINQSWDPPMDGQDEMVDLLVETYAGNVKHTFGGISMNGCMHMNDEYGQDGDEMTDTWTIFGDPSLMVRTDKPRTLIASHSLTIDENATTFMVSCLENGALVCMSKDNVINSTGWTLAGSTTLNPTSLVAGDTLDIVITGYNLIPYYSQVVVTSSTTGIPALSGKSFSIFPNPTSGNISIELSKEIKTVSMSIVNSIGATVKAINYSTDANGKFTADFSDLSPGVYTMMIFNEEEIYAVERIVRE
jgi:hypothetical protein